VAEALGPRPRGRGRARGRLAAAAATAPFGDIVLVIIVACSSFVMWSLETTADAAAVPIGEHGRAPVPGAETTQALPRRRRRPGPRLGLGDRVAAHRVSEVIVDETGADAVVVPICRQQSGPPCP